jgi:hypothetical protein
MISKRDLPPKFHEGKDFQSGASRRGNEAFGNDVFGNTSSATSVIMSFTQITFIIIR